MSESWNIVCVVKSTVCVLRLVYQRAKSIQAYQFVCFGYYPLVAVNCIQFSFRVLTTYLDFYSSLNFKSFIFVIFTIWNPNWKIKGTYFNYIVNVETTCIWFALTAIIIIIVI